MMGKNNGFGRKTLAFCAIVFLAIVVINFVYTTSVLPKKTFYHKEVLYREYVSNLPDGGVDYLFFGDSHAFHAINPDFIPGAHNYATGAENYAKTFYKLRKAIYKDKIKVGSIVLEIDPHTFSTRLTDKTNLFSELEIYSQFVSFKEIERIRNDSFLQLWLEAKMPFIGNGKEFGILIKKPDFNEVSSGGWLKNKGNFSLIDKNASALFNYKSLYEGQQRISNVSFDYFIKTLELAEENNISVVLIKYPHTKEYDDLIKKHNVTEEDYYAKIFSRINATLDNYHVLDYYSLFPEKDYLFGDPEHVNYIGSEILSKQVYQDLQNLNISKNYYLRVLREEPRD